MRPGVVIGNLIGINWLVRCLMLYSEMCACVRACVHVMPMAGNIDVLLAANTENIHGYIREIHAHLSAHNLWPLGVFLIRDCKWQDLCPATASIRGIPLRGTPVPHLWNSFFDFLLS